jgi:phosphoribosylaminoimidazole-succinocarboxamide synthase
MRTVARRRQIYEGKAKILYEGPEPGTLIQYFKDDATAFNAQKRGTISGKGVINNRISEHIFTALQVIGVPTHFIRRINMREQLIRQFATSPRGRCRSAWGSRKARSCRAPSLSIITRTMRSATR